MSSKKISITSKLFKLKEWLTISETAKHLSIMFGEEVTDADVLRLGLDRHLRLSVNFVNHANAKRGDKFIPLEEWEVKFRETASWQNANFLVRKDGMIAVYFPVSDLVFCIEDNDLVNTSGPWAFGPNEKLKSSFLNRLSIEKQNEYLNNLIEEAIIYAHNQSETFQGKVPPSLRSFEGNVITIKGVWDLPMLGTERLDIEDEYQMLTNGPEVTLTGLDGAFVEDGNGVIWQLQDMFDKEFIEAQQSEDRKKKSVEFYAESLKKRISNNEIDEKEAEKLLDQHKKNIERPMAYENMFYPAGGLPEDSVIVVRTRELRVFLNNLSPEDSEGEIPQGFSILDSNHRFHAKELKIAIEAWTELYEKNPPKQVPPGGHKRYIEKWIEEKYPRIAQRAKARISTIINPNPKGGASPTN